MPAKIALALTAEGANDAIHGMIADYAGALEAVGLPVVYVRMDPGELVSAHKQMQQGQVAFALTWLGLAQELAGEINGKRVNVWEHVGVPLLKLHGDHPAYFGERHADIPRNGVNFYVAQEFIAYRDKWLPDARALTALLPPMPLSPIARADVSVKARRAGKLVFLKNGNDPRQLQRSWRENLPHGVARLTESLAEAIAPVGLTRGRLDIADFVARFLAANGIQPSSASYFMPFFTAQMDDYLRRLKSELIATALLDLPVVIQGGNWDHVDFAKRKAQLRPGQSYQASRSIFSEQLGVIDMSPNLDTGPHERVMRAAGSFALVLTNHQSWLPAALPGFDELMFDFTVESIAERAADAISHPDRYLERAIAFGEQFRERYSREAVGNAMVDMAELAVLQWSVEKPMLQPFFVWAPRPA